MTVEIKCSICKKFIKAVTPKEFNALTGEEICDTCETRLNNILAEIEKTAKAAIQDIQTRHENLKNKYQKAEKLYEGFHEQVTDILRRTTSEIEKIKKEVLSGSNND